MQPRWRGTVAWTMALAAAFACRLAFGLSHDFWFEDETQIFLIGVRHHATGAWPYFGPDVVWTRSQIPGALQGLLVGLPMDVIAVPEAPFVLLVPFAALALAARAREGPGRFAVAAGAMAAGALGSGSLLLPTLWRFGADAGTGGVQRNLRPHLVAPWVLATIAGRFLSFASL